MWKSEPNATRSENMDTFVLADIIGKMQKIVNDVVGDPGRFQTYHRIKIDTISGSKYGKTSMESCVTIGVTYDCGTDNRDAPYGGLFISVHKDESISIRAWWTHQVETRRDIMKSMETNLRKDLEMFYPDLRIRENKQS